MTSNSQKVFDEVGYNLSEEVKALIKSLDGAIMETRDRDTAAELIDLKEALDACQDKVVRLEDENSSLKNALASMDGDNAALRKKIEGLEETIGLLERADGGTEDA